jgi:hypothetical protein
MPSTRGETGTTIPKDHELLLWCAKVLDFFMVHFVCVVFAFVRKARRDAKWFGTLSTFCT